MKILAFLFALLGVAGSVNAATPTHGSVGKGHGVDVPSGDTNCGGTLRMNFDGSAENGYGWMYGGIVPPYYGAFAECYNVTGVISGVELKLTGVGDPCQPCDVYLWNDGGGQPGAALGVVAGYNPCPVATWPNVSTHDLCCGSEANGPVWVGYWAGAFANQRCGYYVAADTNGFGGCPLTNVAPGIGYPTGWINTSAIWAWTQAIGIGVWAGGDVVIGCSFGPPPPSSVPAAREELSSWGRIKAQNR